MAKIPKEPSQIFLEITADYKRIFGEDLLSIILYGSAARGEYRYKKSDINFLMVLTENGMKNLRRCIDLIPKWRKRNVGAPLFLTQEYINASLDSFLGATLPLSCSWNFGSTAVDQLFNDQSCCEVVFGVFNPPQKQPCRMQTQFRVSWQQACWAFVRDAPAPQFCRYESEEVPFGRKHQKALLPVNAVSGKTSHHLGLTSITW